MNYIDIMFPILSNGGTSNLGAFNSILGNSVINFEVSGNGMFDGNAGGIGTSGTGGPSNIPLPDTKN